MQSGAIASRLRAVSSSVSPLLRLDEDTLMLTASADKRFAASSKDVLVRVDASKKRLMTVLPRRAGTFFTSRLEISLKCSAVSKMPMISAGVRSRIPSRSRLRNGFSISMLAGRPPAFRQKKQGVDLAFKSITWPFEDADGLDVIEFFQHDLYDLTRLCRDSLTDEVGLDRQFAMLSASVDKNGELNLSRPAEIHQLVKGSADRAA